MNDLNQSKIQIPNSKFTNPWPVALIIIIAGAFILAAFVAVTMIRQSVELVIPDYYEQDLRHSERMEQEQRAQGLETPLRMDFDAAAKTLAFTFPQAGASGTIKLYRPSDAALDLAVVIATDPGGRQLLNGSALASGLWRVQVSWQQDGEGYYATESLVVP